jgi:putative phosphoribosyl transferase
MTTQFVKFKFDSVELEGNLSLPPQAHGVIVFAHGSGSSRFSPRNRYVAQALQATGLGTLLFDLLTPAEEQEDLRTTRLRFNIHLLARRLASTADLLTQHPQTAHLRIGFFGASTGGAAALQAAAERPELVHAVVVRGGRPDLAEASLVRVHAPTLLIVGGHDLRVVQLNEEAYDQLTTEKRLEIIPGASHLFEEPGALEEVAQLAAGWFNHYLTPIAV